MSSSVSQRGKSLVVHVISGYQEAERVFNNPRYIARRANHYFTQALDWYENGRFAAASLLLELAIVDYKKMGLSAKVYEAEDWLILAKNGILN